MGSPAVADWWLARPLVVEEETEAAAAPARTRERAKMRMASFMEVTSSNFGLTERAALCTLKS
jgi:hypothetical protein